MEVLATILEPHKELVGAVAGIVTVAQMFSGSFICWDIFRQGTTGSHTIMPFVGGLIMSILNFRYGFILRDDMIIKVNLAGLAINIIYLMIFFHYSQRKMQAWAQMGMGMAFSGAVLFYAEWEDSSLVEARLGMIITVFMFYLIASPLFGLKHIIANKSTEGMPFPIILSGTVVTFMWLLYGIILRNDFMVIQNVVALALCAIQLALFAIYPSKPKTKPKVKAKKSE